MAFLKNVALLGKLRGAIGKQVVFKKYGDKTVVSSYPDMGNIKASPVQKLNRGRFSEAVVYALSIIRDPVKKKEYAKKLKKGKSVYNAAVKEYMDKAKEDSKKKKEDSK